MTCQRCSDEASVHITETVDGDRRELHLCLPCAKAAGLVLPEKGPVLGIDTLVQKLLIAHVGEIIGELASLTCPICGLRFMEFRNEGRLGCPHDYEAFEMGLLPLIGSAHPATRHIGKTPRRETSAVDRDRLRLRFDLRAAVGREDYEEAAKIRDRLRRGDADS